MKKPEPKYLVDGKWLSEKEYLALPEIVYEKAVKNRKKIST